MIITDDGEYIWAFSQSKRKLLHLSTKNLAALESFDLMGEL